MAQLTNTELETHPSGTGGLNALINGNWARLEELFDPALGSGDAGFSAFMKAVTRSTLTGLATGDYGVTWNGSNFVLTKGFEGLSYTATTDLPLDFDDARVKTLSITGNLTLTTSDIKQGLEFRIAITSDASIRTLTFPAGWTFIGAAAPANIAASKTGILKLICTTAVDSGVLATWEVEP